MPDFFASIISPIVLVRKRGSKDERVRLDASEGVSLSTHAGAETEKMYKSLRLRTYIISPPAVTLIIHSIRCFLNVPTSYISHVHVHSLCSSMCALKRSSFVQDTKLSWILF
jgi:hypothetical protein